MYDYGANVGALVLCRFLLTPRIILRGVGRPRFVLDLICHSSWECVYVFSITDGKGGWWVNGRLNWFYLQICILSYYAVILFDTYD